MKKKTIPAPPPIGEFRLPRYRELTDVGLYLEQVVRLLNTYLAPLGEGELTASMVSNYVKQGLLPRPEKKLYYAGHLARLLFIGAAKNAAALEDIRLLLELQEQKCELSAAYDSFCQSFEEALFAAFGLTRDAPPEPAVSNLPAPCDAENSLLQQLIRAAVARIYLDHSLRLFRQQNGADVK
ncbi:MAG: DUF1836 domain-containing protein [Firmicutes bacterium]|nr:DUF1836 domain-containing protein [Bacillota bacterium]